jgi:Uncharacterized protein conserved in bacteria (DUF2252)
VGRPGPVDLLDKQAETRLPELVPVRYGRMAVSPFYFLQTGGPPNDTGLVEHKEHRDHCAVAIAAYLGNSTIFDEALADFAETYADQNEKDFELFKEAISSGRIKAVMGV